MGVGVVVCIFATRSPLTLGIGLFLSGCLMAPTVGALYERLGALTPASVRTEVFGWMSSGAMIGGALGSSIGGQVIESLGIPYIWALAALLILTAAACLIQVPPHHPTEEAVVEEVQLTQT
jgi:predicted MFS family arabinose efflux permease